MESLIRNLRLAFRGLRRAPVFTVVAILCLGLGLGANTAIFSAVNTILLRSLPFADVDRIMQIGNVYTRADGGTQRVSASPFNYRAYQERTEIYERLGALRARSFVISGADDAARVEGAAITGGWMRTMGIQALEGRILTPDDERPGDPGPVVVLGYGLWQRRFGGEAGILGQELNLDGRNHTVVGILPPGVQFPYQAELWVPLGLDLTDERQLHRHYIGVFGLLKEGVSQQQAQAEMDALSLSLADEFPNTHADWGAELRSFREELLRDTRPKLLALQVAVAFLLLIACVNVANMFLARSQEQVGEVAVRAALGASRRQLMTQLVLQGLLIAFAGGALGLILAAATLRPLVALSPVATMNTFYQDIGIDASVVLFTLGLSILVGVLFSLVPALRASRPDLQTVLKDSGQRSGASVSGRRLLSILVTVEVALAVVLLAGAALTVRSLRQLETQDPGFNAENILTVTIDLSSERYPEPSQRVRFFEEAVDRLEALPEVEAAAVTSALPLTVQRGRRSLAAFSVEDYPLESPSEFLIVNHRLVGPGLLEILDIPVDSGRSFDLRDHGDAPGAAIVSQELVDRYLAGRDAVGRRVKRGSIERESPWLNIVGVVDNVADFGLSDSPSESGPTWYLPYTQHPFNAMRLVVRSRSAPADSLVGPVREVIRELDPNQPVYGVETLEERLAGSYRLQRFSSLLFAGFGFLGLVLAAVGLYGVLSYSVTQRRSEMGIRIAMGATSGQIQRLVLQRGLSLVAAGLVIGLAAALYLNRLIEGLLFGVTADDPLIYGLIISVLLAVGALSCLLPARRASRTDPVEVLRPE
ncbi:MAG: ABC transporter permease [Acidobacteriota bacterium]